MNSRTSGAPAIRVSTDIMLSCTQCCAAGGGSWNSACNSENVLRDSKLVSSYKSIMIPLAAQLCHIRVYLPIMLYRTHNVCGANKNKDKAQASGLQEFHADLVAVIVGVNLARYLKCVHPIGNQFANGAMKYISQSVHSSLTISFNLLQNLVCDTKCPS